MAYLETKGATVYPGAQGVSHVFEQKCGQLLKGYWYASYDKQENLPFLDGYRWVPRVDAYSAGDFDFCLGDFGNVWSDRSTFFGFREVST